MKSKKKVLIASIIVLIIAVFAVGVCGIIDSFAQAEEVDYDAKNPVEKDIFDLDDIEFPQQVYKDEGYDNLKDWWEALQEERKGYDGVSNDILEELRDYFDDEQKQELRDKEKQIVNARNFTDLNAYVEEYEALVRRAVEEQEAANKISYSSTSGSYSGGSYSGNYSNFRSAGVLYDSGFRYTYYSSRVLYHYNTANWDLGDDGIYRENGMVVVASDAYPNGTVLESELFGTCIVRDCGVGRGDTLDVYTAY